MRVMVDLSMNASQEEVLSRYAEDNKVDVVVSRVKYEKLQILDVNSSLSDNAFTQEQQVLASELNIFNSNLQRKGSRITEVVVANMTTLWETNLVELHKWMYALSRILVDDPMQKHFVYLPDLPTSREMYLYEAEGEVSAHGGRRLLYARSDFILFYLREWLRGRSDVVLIAYPSPRPFLRPLAAIRVLRSYGVLWFRVAIHVLNVVRHWPRRRRSKMRALREKGGLCVVSRGTAHTEYLAGLVEDRRVTYLIVDNFLSFPANRDLAAALLGEGVPTCHIYDCIGFGSILSEASSVCLAMIGYERHRSPMVLRTELFAEKYGVSIDISQIVREALVNSFEANLIARALDSIKVGNSGMVALAHCEVLTHHAFHIARWGKKAGVTTIQVAFGTYDIRPSPDFIWSDWLCCFSEKSGKDLAKLSAHFRQKAVYWGNLLVEDGGSNLARRTESNSDIVFFTQPYDDDNEMLVVGILERWCAKNNASLTIALHPRDSPSKYAVAGAISSVMTHDQLLPCRARVLSMARFAVTRTSNVAYALLMAGVPIINVLLSPSDLSVSHEYYAGYPLIARSAKQLEAILDDGGGYVGLFEEFRASYSEKAWGGLGRHCFMSSVAEATGMLPLDGLRQVRH